MAHSVLIVEDDEVNFALPRQTSNDRVAHAFLKMLDRSRDRWEFRTFDDAKDRRDKSLIRKFSGRLEDHLTKLRHLNASGAGVFVTINPTDGKGVSSENVTEVRAIFADTDGAELEPLLALKPHIVVESSPGKFHTYWLVADCARSQFKLVQQAIARRFGTDRSVNDLARVMRLPGFMHRKATPFEIAFNPQSMDPKRVPYTIGEIVEGLELDLREATTDHSVKQSAGLDTFAVPAHIRDADLGSNTSRDPPEESRENVARAITMLRSIDPDIDYLEWRQVVWSVLSTRWKCAEFLVRNWSKRGTKFTAAGFAAIVRDFDPAGGTGYGTLVHIARQHGYVDPATEVTMSAPSDDDDGTDEGVTIESFYAYMPMHNYIFVPTRDTWPASSIDARLPWVMLNGKKIAPSRWLDKHRPIEQMTWVPGEPMLLKDRLVANGGWSRQKGVTCFNAYRAPVVQHDGDAKEAGPWLDHIRNVFPEDAEHILDWFAHRVQRPGEKINHALVLGGEQGVGKDTILEPVKRAVGAWNFEEVGPQQILGRFNHFLKAVILRVSEVRDLGDVDRYGFYEHMKTIITAPPDVLRIDEKNLREYYILNCCGVVFTTNHKETGLFLPPDDRRHYVAWSELTKENFDEGYWKRLWCWYENGGFAHVAAFLGQRDLSGFDPKAPPKKTTAFWAIVSANRAPEESELADAIERLKTPQALTINDLILATSINVGGGADLNGWLSERKNRCHIPQRLGKCGYTAVRNENDKSDGQWRIAGKRQTVYALKTLSVAERVKAAQELAEKGK
jgi:hypothetical protein